MNSRLQFRLGTVVLFPFVVLLVSSAILAGSARTGFHAFAESISVSKKADSAILNFSEGIRLVSSEGFRISASEGIVILSTKGFPELPREINREEVTAGKLPKLPEVSFSKERIKLLQLSGSVVVKSRDFTLSGRALETRNGGDNWNLVGDFSLVLSDGSGRSVLGRNLFYDRTAGRVTTVNPVQISGFTKTTERVTLNASKIVFDVRGKVFSLTGSARISFGDYLLSSREILANLKTMVLETTGDATLITGESVVKAEKIRIQIEDGRVKVSASGVSGSVRVR